MSAPTWDQLRAGGYMIVERLGLWAAVYPNSAGAVALVSQTGGRDKMDFLDFGVDEVPRVIEKLQAALQVAEEGRRRYEEAEAAQLAHEVVMRAKEASS
ncbi:hypothetical protein [Ottowia testudinis]|uniref:Uncharacterized protein n=1 Tax=Ottowia testudinis TaxID=2816950 RepID=A0A975H2U4_9BURK|nr:hypothetical protein [Ottowia testudinis]QTD44566.1 hypothetical protein J1M35_15920 [Ottowia testudinis]